MNKLIYLGAVLSLVSCGGDSGGGGGSSDNSIIPMISNINCGDDSCVSDSLTKSSSSKALEWAGEFYEEINDTIIPEVKNTFSDMDKVLRSAEIASCADIPSSGSTEVDYEGTTVTVTAKTPTGIDVFNKGTVTNKAVEAYNASSQKFFEAEFNCDTPRVAYVKVNLPILNSSEVEKTVLYFYENGDDKAINLFTHYQGETNKEGYMLLFETDGSDFESYFGWDNDIDGAGTQIILSAVKEVANGVRIVADSSGNVDFTDDSHSAVNPGSTDNGNLSHHYCYTAAYSNEACGGSHPSLGLLSGKDLNENLTDVTGDGKFTKDKIRNLDFSF
ncbi:MAG: hypothetical protein CME62_13385 [Halobacteriovoraceae bacterium]|nr:hypothetical protein [Halobacteriovoraceae bacterium]|tara:strand:+ start:3778 stop:4770 length:993 start_codon:yes stop_codon:yes gene_type:complete